MGCSVHTNRHGKLTFRLYYNGREFWEGIGSADTPANRKLAEAQAVIISDEIGRKAFDYLKWFPEGNKADLFRPARPAPVTVREYYDQWIVGKTPPFVRKSCERDYKQHFTAYILPRFGAEDLAAVDPEKLGAFLNYLVKERGLKLKTARNIIDSSFRALMRDARLVARLIDIDPFVNVDWPDSDEIEPDPFSEAERDALIEYFRQQRRHYYPWIFTLFWTGMRPSEAAGLQRGDVDLRTGRTLIARSRNLGEINRTKTKHSKRVITLFPNVLEVLNAVPRLRATETDHVFLNTEGRPIVQDNWRKEYWYGALTALKIRPRKFYCTRHTFISVMLQHGENIKRVADYAGTSVVMIEKHYAKFIAEDTSFGLRAVAATMGAEMKKAREG